MIFRRFWDKLMHMNSREHTEEKVFSYIRKYHMIEAGDKIVIGVSGGADSVCLLFLLCKLMETCPIKLHVCHINHGIRPEAHLDAEYVEKLCMEKKLPFYLKELDIPRLAKERKMTEEEAGRYARYEAFDQIAESLGGAKIAVAHNSNDRSETLLFNLFRGSGIKGLSSIRPVRDNIIRPLLCLERGEIEDYLKCIGALFCNDATNDTDEFCRNKIRHNILPYVEKEIMHGAVSNINRVAQMAQDLDDYLSLQTQSAIESCCEGDSIDILAFLKEHIVIQKRIIYELMVKKCGFAKDISSVHVDKVYDLIKNAGNRSVNLPYGLEAVREYNKVFFSKNEDIKQSKPKDQKQEDVVIDIKSTEFADGQKTILVDLPEGSKIAVSLINNGKEPREIPRIQYTKWFDYDKIKKSLVLRSRRTGDYLSIAGAEDGLSHKLIKDYMINEKIPKSMREKIPLIAEDNHILWLIGYRISEYYKVDCNTKRILQIELFTGEER